MAYENRLKQLVSIISKFDELNRKDDPTQKEMPEELQRAIVKLILVDKKGSIQERLTITHNDITIAFKDLAMIIVDTDCYQMEALKKYQEQDIATLLIKGVAKYNQKNGVCIELMTHEITLPQDVCNIIECNFNVPIIHLARVSKSYQRTCDIDNEIVWNARLDKIKLLSWKTKFNKNEFTKEKKTSKEIFQKKPKLRINNKYILLDKKGTEWFARSRRINDLILLQRIRKGQITVEDIATAREQISTTQQSVKVKNNKLLDNPWIRDRIVDKTLTFQQLAEATNDGLDALCSTDIRCFLEQEENWPYIALVIGLSAVAVKALENGWVREQLANKTLTFQQLADITWGGSEALCNTEIQCLLTQKANQQYIALVSRVYSEAKKMLKNAWVVARLADKTLTFPQLVKVTDEGSEALCNPDIQYFLEQKNHLKYIPVIALSSHIALSSLCSPEIIQYLFKQKENWPYAGQIIGLSNAAIALGSGLVRTRLVGGMLTFQQLISVDSIASQALCDQGVQDFLGKEANRLCIGQVIGLPWAANALCSTLVRDQLKDKKLTFKQLLDINKAASILLCDPTIQDFIKYEANLSNIGQILGFSWDATEAMKNAWVRRQIADKNLAFKQLADINHGVRRALCNPKIHDFLKKEAHLLNIDQVIDLTWEAAAALENDWVRARLVDRTLNFQQLAGITWTVSTVLRNSDIQPFLDQQGRKKSLALVSGLSSHALKALEDGWVRKQIADNQLNFKRQLANITEVGSNLLCKREIQLFLEQKANQLYIREVICFSSQAARALDNEWVRKQITDKKLTFQELAGVTWETSQLLCNLEIQTFLDQKSSPINISQVIGLSENAIYALKNEWIRAKFLAGKLTFQQFAGVSRLVSHLLYNRNIQAFLEANPDLLNIDEVVSFSDEAARALENTWVRNRLVDRTLPVKQLTAVTLKGSNMLRDLNAQHSFDEEKNRLHIVHFINSIDNPGYDDWYPSTQKKF